METTGVKAKIVVKIMTNPATLEKLAEIQDQMRELCLPQDRGTVTEPYDEFYKVKSEYGFIKITIPQKQRA